MFLQQASVQDARAKAREAESINEHRGIAMNTTKRIVFSLAVLLIVLVLLILGTPLLLLQLGAQAAA